MKQVIATEKVPIKLWLDDIDDGALEQARNLANLPFVFKHIAIMPDAHQGYGMPIGGVMATRGVVIPNAVGVDIGCGVCAIKTSHIASMLEQEHLMQIIEHIKKVIPVGFNKHPEQQDIIHMPILGDLPITLTHLENAAKSIGTLGGGNHFIEIQKDTDGYIWIMIHSGSRNLGFKIAQHYNKVAIEFNERWHSQVPKKWGLAFLPLDTKIGQVYIREMEYAVEYALANRKLMMKRMMSLLPTNIDSGSIRFRRFRSLR